jgi:hypothetical protein
VTRTQIKDVQKAFTDILKNKATPGSARQTMTGPRVRSGSRTMSIKQVLKDELSGGDFLASMSEREFLFFQKLLSVKRGSKKSY